MEHATRGLGGTVYPANFLGTGVAFTLVRKATGGQHLGFMVPPFKLSVYI